MAVRTRTIHESKFVGGDARVEDFLDQKGVTYTFNPSLGPDNFDAEKSLRNQARIAQPLDHTRVEQYAEAMRRGDQFPPVVAYGDPGSLIIADGNHRLAAAKSARKPLPTYTITKADPRTIVLITFEANTRHGLPTSEDERKQHALYLLENGASIPEAAAAVNLPRKVVEKASSERAADQRFLDAGLPLIVFDKLTLPMRRRLKDIKTDAGFKAAVQLVMDAGLKSDDIFTLVTGVNEFRDSEPQVQYIKELRETLYAERIGDTGGGVFKRRGVGPKARLGLAIANVTNLPDDLELVTKVYVGPEREEAAKKMRAAARRLNEIAKALSA